MTEAFKELLIVKEHLIKLALSIQGMNARKLLSHDVALAIRGEISDMYGPADEIERILTDLVLPAGNEG